MGEVVLNKKYKDRLFKLVFGTKGDLLSLYNAINGTTYINEDDITINTIEECVYMGMRNDVSFLVCDVMNLYEHQSTDNPNLPLRGFFYLSMLYKGLFGEHKDLYSSRLIMLPTPQFIIFYNGDSEEPDDRYMNLSDAYIEKISGTPALECTARLLNINYGHNKEIMDKCKRLHDYSLLIKRVKDNIRSGMDKEAAVIAAVDSCIEDGILADILIKHKAEVTAMLLEEYNETLHINSEKSISYEEGREEGRLDVLISLVNDGLLQPEIAAERSNKTIEEFRGLMTSRQGQKD